MISNMPVSTEDPTATIDRDLNQRIHPVNKLLTSSDAYHWQSFIVRNYLLNPFFDPEPSFLTTTNVIPIPLETTAQLSCFHGKYYGTKPSYSSTISILPQGERISFSWPETTRVLEIYLPSITVLNAAQTMEVRGSSQVELMFRFAIEEAAIFGFGQALLAELNSGGLGGRLYAETLGQALTMYLLRHYSSLAVTRDPPEHKLGMGELARALDYINEHLAQDITLADLAAVVNLSPSHFARVFKRSLGLAPHQYMIQQRVERGRTLLLNHPLTVAEVAQRVGFADHSHFTRHFKRIHGFPPKLLYQRRMPR